MDGKKHSLKILGADIGYRTRRFGAGVSLVLRGVDLCVNPGETAALIGANGTGKTTLIRAAAGILAPIRGQVLLGDKDCGSCRVAYLPQAGLVFPWRKAILDASLLLEVARVPLWRRLRVTVRTMRHFGFEAPLRARCHQLSGGQKQGICITRCLAGAHHADLVLIDEPTNHLDKDIRARFIRELPPFLANIRSPILLSTHDQELGEALGGTRYLVADGVVRRL